MKKLILKQTARHNFDRVTISLHILYTANQETEGSQDRVTSFLGRHLGDVLCTSEAMACGY